MSSMGLREKAVLASLAMVFLYGIAAVIWFLKMDITNKQGEWYRARRTYHNACRRFRDESKLIDDRQEWEDRYAAEKAAMPMFEEGKDTATTWLERIGDIAKKNHVEISSRKSSKTVSADDVQELEIECQWEGALESLVKFMYELENTRDGMFDFSSLNFKPSAKQGYLKGSFTVTCAFMRKKD